MEPVSPILADRFRDVSDVVFILLRWDETYGHLAALADRVGCSCTIVLVSGRDAESPDDRERRWADRVRILDPDDVVTGRLQGL